jgi:hypothetical protein
MTKTKISLRRQSRGGGFKNWMKGLNLSKIINFLNTLTKVTLLVLAAFGATSKEQDEKNMSMAVSMYLTAVQLRQSDMGKGNLDLAETVAHILLSGFIAYQKLSQLYMKRQNLGSNS